MIKSAESPALPFMVIIYMYTCTSISAMNQLFPTLMINFPCAYPRVRDFPPDETSLIGVAMGYSQSGKLCVSMVMWQCKYTECRHNTRMTHSLLIFISFS